MRFTVKTVVAVFGLLLGIASVTHAQSTITGVVTDATGAVLPGVTVDVRSPVLIEQVKTTVSDGEGQYRIADLRPGIYSVTASLPGFTTVVRDEIRLESNFIARIDLQLRVGSLAETIVVEGAAPVVDVQSSQRREVLTREVMDLLPTGRTYANVARTLPALNVGGLDVGGSSSAESRGSITAYGGPGQQISIDGLSIAPGQGSGTDTVLFLNHSAVQEYVYQVNGGAAESQTGGVQVNMVPRTGGNTFAGNGVAIWTNSRLNSTNASPGQLAAGLAAPPKLNELYDYNASIGGPIVRNRLWFFNSYRWWTANTKLPIVHDGKMGPVGEQVIDENLNKAYTLRLTGQLTSNHRVTAMYEYAPRIEYFNNISSQLRRPEATGRAVPKHSYVAQMKWTGTITDKVLAELGWSGNMRGYRGVYQPVIKGADENPPYGDIAKFEAITGYFFNNTSNEWFNPFWRHQTNGSIAYVTGAHAFKTGFQLGRGSYTTELTSQGDIIQRYRAGVPFAVEVLPTPVSGKVDLHVDLGVYVQDTWTIKKRLTLSPGLRIDKFIGRIPEQNMPAGRFLPARSFAAIDNLPNWTNISPRFGASFDLFGNGRTAVKGSAGRFVAPEAVAIQIRYNPSGLPGVSGAAATGDVRDWTDTNGDDIAQESEIGPSRNPAFGLRRNTNPDPNLTRGYDYLYNLTFEHELRQNFGLSIGYNRRSVRNLSWLDNEANVPEDYQLLMIADPRGGGEPLPVYQLFANRVRPLNEVEKNSNNNTRTYNGVDMFVRGRLSNGIVFSGGTSTGRIIAKTCDVENPNSLRFCDRSQYDIPFATAFKASGSVPLPWAGLQLSAVFQSLPGAERVVNYLVTRAQLPALSTVSSVSVRLNEPGSLFLERINQLDLSLGWRTRMRKLGMRPQVELFNALNANPATVVTTQYPVDGQPQAIMLGRLLRLGVQVDF